MKSNIRENDKDFDPRRYVKPGLSEQEILEIREAFLLFDTDNSGFIEKKELKEAMKALGFHGKNSNLETNFVLFDDNDDGKLDFLEFLNKMTMRLSEKYSREEITDVFNNNFAENGIITLKSLKRMAKELGRK